MTIHGAARGRYAPRLGRRLGAVHGRDQTAYPISPPAILTGWRATSPGDNAAVNPAASIQPSPGTSLILLPSNRGGGDRFCSRNQRGHPRPLPLQSAASQYPGSDCLRVWNVYRCSATYSSAPSDCLVVWCVPPTYLSPSLPI